MGKPILCLDFDGVIHRHDSGYQGARNIPDPPVDGALDFISRAMDEFTVHIYSSRSHQWGGRRAMKKWLYQHVLEEIEKRADAATRTKGGLKADPIMRLMDMSSMEPFYVVAEDTARQFVDAIQWPQHKPPALVTLDDRALTFTGKWPKLETLRSFKPWNR